MPENDVFTTQASNLLRGYYVQVLDMNQNVLETFTCGSLNELIEWAKETRLRRLIEIEEHL